MYYSIIHKLNSFILKIIVCIKYILYKHNIDLPYYWNYCFDQKVGYHFSRPQFPFLHMLYKYFQLHSLFHSPSVCSMASTLSNIPFSSRATGYRGVNSAKNDNHFGIPSNLLCIILILYFTPTDARVIIQWGGSPIKSINK